MSTTHKISADFYDDSFKLISIHSSLEDYAMTYVLNFACQLYLKRMKTDLHFDQSLSFAAFEWDDEVSDTYWSLISNKCKVEVTMPSEGFFENNTSLKTGYLIRERREVDYFLKVDTENQLMLEQHVKLINKIPKVITAYSVETTTLKSKRNLIF